MKKVSSYRPNVSYKTERSENFTRASYLQKVLKGSGYSKFLNHELEQLSDKESLMLARGTALLKICGNCHLGFIVPKKNYFKYQGANVHKFGYTFRCMCCALPERFPMDDLKRLKHEMLAEVALRDAE